MGPGASAPGPSCVEGWPGTPGIRSGIGDERGRERPKDEPYIAFRAWRPGRPLGCPPGSGGLLLQSAGVGPTRPDAGPGREPEPVCLALTRRTGRAFRCHRGGRGSRPAAGVDRGPARDLHHRHAPSGPPFQGRRTQPDPVPDSGRNGRRYPPDRHPRARLLGRRNSARLPGGRQRPAAAAWWPARPESATSGPGRTARNGSCRGSFFPGPGMGT